MVQIRTSPAQFEGTFKTLLICHYTSKHSIENANCEEDNKGFGFALSQLINLNKYIYMVYIQGVPF